MDTSASPARRRSAAAAAAGGSSLRQRVLDAAVASLIEQGSARTTTLEVQRRAGVSRGALLHHFPTHAALLAATVDELVRRNEQAVNDALAGLQGTDDPLERAIRALASATMQPAYLAELELWAVARCDAALRASLLPAERKARKASERVLQSIFGAAATEPATAAVIAMSLEFLRGLAVSGVLRSSAARRQQLITQWVAAAKLLLVPGR